MVSLLSEPLHPGKLFGSIKPLDIHRSILNFKAVNSLYVIVPCMNSDTDNSALYHGRSALNLDYERECLFVSTNSSCLKSFSYKPLLFR